MKRSIEEMVILVTGASSGIGASLSELLGRRGAQLALVARRAEELAAVASRSGPEALPIVADVTSRADVQRALDVTLARFGRLDVWINNAGRGITRSVAELTDEDLDDMLRVNLKSVLYGMQVALPHFKERGSGQVINVSSTLGRVPLAPWRSAYLAAKHAANALTACLRMELRDAFPGIEVTAVHPGVVATDFGVRALHGGPVSGQVVPNAQTPEEVAEVIASVIEVPRADVYTRPAYQALVASYYAAEDLAVWEDQHQLRPPRSP